LNLPLYVCVMFEKLQSKWKVGGTQVLIILCTFAIGGSLTGYLGRKLLVLAGIEKGWYFLPIYIIVVTIIWPMMVLLVSIPFGQFRFFSRYLGRMANKLGISGTKSSQTPDSTAPSQVSLAIFASGAGSNAAQIIEHFRNHPHIQVGCIVCNKEGAGVIQIAHNQGIKLIMIDKERFFRGDGHVHELKGLGIDFIVLAGFLWKIPASLIEAFPNRMVNIHPALLPKYGGKGMYGLHVHQAVVANQERETGITIHQVDAQYDHGKHIFQARCPVEPTDTPEMVAQKVHQLEHKYFPAIIEKTILELQNQG